MNSRQVRLPRACKWIVLMRRSGLCLVIALSVSSGVAIAQSSQYDAIDDDEANLIESAIDQNECNGQNESTNAEAPNAKPGAGEPVWDEKKEKNFQEKLGQVFKKKKKQQAEVTDRVTPVMYGRIKLSQVDTRVTEGHPIQI